VRGVFFLVFLVGCALDPIGRAQAQAGAEPPVHQQAEVELRVQPPDHVIVDVPPACGDAGAFVGSVESLAGRSVDAPGFSARVLIAGADAGYALHVRAPGLDRTLSSSDCGSLFDAAVVIVALALNPELSIEEEEPDLPPEPSSASVRLSLRAAPTLGVLPDLGILTELGFGVQLDAFGASLSGIYSFPSARTLDGYDGGASFQLVGGSLRACATVVGPLVVCLGLDLAALRGEGFGLTQNRTRYLLYKAGRIEAAAAIPVGGGVELGLGASLLVPIGRPTFVVDGAGEIFRVGEIAGQVFAELAWRGAV
jgi:hypothetical protein